MALGDLLCRKVEKGRFPQAGAWILSLVCLPLRHRPLPPSIINSFIGILLNVLNILTLSKTVRKHGARSAYKVLLGMAVADLMVCI